MWKHSLGEGKGSLQGNDVTCVRNTPNDGYTDKNCTAATESVHLGPGGLLLLEPLGQGSHWGNQISVLHEHADSWDRFLSLEFIRGGAPAQESESLTR